MLGGGREIGRWKSDDVDLPLGTIRNVVMNLRIKNLTQINLFG